MNDSHYPDIPHAVTQHHIKNAVTDRPQQESPPSKRYMHLLFPHAYLHVPRTQNLVRSTYLHTVPAYCLHNSPYFCYVNLLMPICLQVKTVMSMWISTKTVQTCSSILINTSESQDKQTDKHK